MIEMKLSKVVIVLLWIILLTGISAINVAAIPETMSYQGYLTDSTGAAIDVPVNITFRIYDVQTGGTALWTEPQSVNVSNGVYSVQLGSVSTLTTLNFDVPYWLGVEVESDGEMNPRQPFDSVPFAVISAMSEFATSAESATSADFATSVADGSVTDGSITGMISASKIEHSGLNADLIDDMDSTDFANVSHIHESADIAQGAGSTLDADLLDGQDSVDFATASHSHGSADITAPLEVTLDTGGQAIYGINTTPGGVGVRGTGGSMGVWGYSDYDGNGGVVGHAGLHGSNYGVAGVSSSSSGHGVYGKNIVGGYAGYFEGPLATTDNVTSAGTVTASSFSGSGTSLTNLDASQLTSGTLPSSRLSGTYTNAVNLTSASNSFIGSGANLTSLNASRLTSGTLPDNRLSGTYASAVNFTNASNLISGDGAGLTNVTASALAIDCPDNYVLQKKVNGWECQPLCQSGDFMSCYTGSAGTFNEGACRSGGRMCSNGNYDGSCTGQVLPTVEICNNQTDDDCNGIVDDAAAQGAPGCTLFYVDADSDNYGDLNDTGICSCNNPDPSAYADNNQDCFDADSRVNPERVGGWTADSYGNPPSWDYDCDGESTKLYTVIDLDGTSCDNDPFEGCIGGGWASQDIPECGVTADYYICDNFIGCSSRLGTKTQLCL